MRRVGTEDNLTDIGTRGHDMGEASEARGFEQPHRHGRRELFRDHRGMRRQRHVQPVPARSPYGFGRSHSSILAPTRGIGAYLYQRVLVPRPEQQREQLSARVHPRRLGAAEYLPRRTCVVSALETEH